MFFSLDGLDGTGKSTQCRLLVERLRTAGRTVTACADPGGTDLGTKLRELILFGREHQMGPRAEALLFMASRAELVDQVIRPALARDEVVVSDRFLLANVVYQGHAGGLDPDLLWRAGELSTGGLTPDLTIVFDVPLEVARARGKHDADRLESREVQYHERVRNGFLLEARRRPQLFTLIDATPAAAIVHEEVWRVVSEFLQRG